MKTVRIVVPLSVILGMVAVAASTETPVRHAEFFGTATNPKTQRVLYTEIHRREWGTDGSLNIETEYRDPTGVAFASRTVRLPAEGFLPAYHFRDERTGAEEGIRIGADGPVMYRRRPGREGAEDKAVPDSGTMVADAGFERLIHRNWDRLVSGGKVKAVLVVPSRLRSFRLMVVKVDESMIEGIPVVTFRMSFSNPLLRLLAPKLLVSYHRDDHEIVAFEGKSNLEDPRGGNYDVDVRYSHSGSGR